MKLTLFIYWYWFATWVYRYYYGIFEDAKSSMDFVCEGILQLLFILILPFVSLLYHPNSNGKDKWAKLCLFTGFLRGITIIMAYQGYKYHNYFYTLSLLIVIAYLIITNVFEKNSKNIHYT